MIFRLASLAHRVALIAAVVCAGALHAAEDPGDAMVADWAGPYAGLFAGHGWGRAKATAPFDAGPGFFYNFGGAPYVLNGNGPMAGATAGYNLQSDAALAGVEAEFGYLGLRGSTLDPNGVATGFDDTTTSFKSDLYGALFARLGVAIRSASLYAKGGGAFLNARTSTVDPCVAPPSGCGTETLTMKDSRTLLGWSAGTGVEWSLTRRWSVKAEYAYFDLGKLRTAGVSSAGDRYTQSVSVSAHTTKIGVNYRW